MTKPKCVVYLPEARDFLQEEVGAVVGALRPAFAITFVRSAPSLERELERGARVGIVVSQAPLSANLLTRLAARSTSCLVFVAPGQSVEAKTAPLGATAVQRLEPERVPRLLARAVTIALIEDLLIRALDALARSSLFAGFEGLREALKQTLASPTPPIEAVVTVSKVARLSHCSRRWADMGWVQVCERSASPHHSTLKEFLVVILFLKGLRLWLMHETLADSARQLGITERTLHDYFVRIARHGPSDVDVGWLPALVLRTEREYFGWLFG